MGQLQIIQNKIFEIRGQRVMLDFDLAELYGTETRVLKQAVKRNIRRFPTDFMFELTKEEFYSLRSQYCDLKFHKEQLELINQTLAGLQSQKQTPTNRRPIGFAEYDKE